MSNWVSKAKLFGRFDNLIDILGFFLGILYQMILELVYGPISGIGYLRDFRIIFIHFLFTINFLNWLGFII